MNSSAAKQRRWWGRKRLKFPFDTGFSVLRTNLGLNMIICRLDALLMHIFTCSIIHLKRYLILGVIFASFSSSSRPFRKIFPTGFFCSYIDIESRTKFALWNINQIPFQIIQLVFYFFLGLLLSWRDTENSTLTNWHFRQKVS